MDEDDKTHSHIWKKDSNTPVRSKNSSVLPTRNLEIKIAQKPGGQRHLLGHSQAKHSFYGKRLFKTDFTPISLHSNHEPYS